MLEALLEKAAAQHPDGWGPWKLNITARRLFMEREPEPYGIRVEELLDDRELLYILLHLSRHKWISDESLGALVRASDAIRAMDRR